MENAQTENSAAGGQSRSNVGLGGTLLAWWNADPEAGNAWLMTAAFIIVALGAIFSHGNWLATWFAFSGAWFAWRVVVVKKVTPNADVTGLAPGKDDK